MIDVKATFNVGYGLYVVTSNDGDKDNGLIVNTVMQISDNPIQFAVGINKQNYSHDVIKQTKKMNVCCLTCNAPFATFERFGFASGKEVNKFEKGVPMRSENGLAYITQHCNAFLSLEVTQYIDAQSHGLFICTLTEAEVLSDQPSMTYAYYHSSVKPKPRKAGGAKGYVCDICGYVYDGESLPEDFICPWCKHGADAFKPLG